MGHGQSGAQGNDKVDLVLFVCRPVQVEQCGLSVARLAVENGAYIIVKMHNSGFIGGCVHGNSCT